MNLALSLQLEEQRLLTLTTADFGGAFEEPEGAAAATATAAAPAPAQASVLAQAMAAAGLAVAAGGGTPGRLGGQARGAPGAATAAAAAAGGTVQGNDGRRQGDEEDDPRAAPRPRGGDGQLAAAELRRTEDDARLAIHLQMKENRDAEAAERRRGQATQGPTHGAEVLESSEEEDEDEGDELELVEAIRTSLLDALATAVGPESAD